MHLHKRKKLQCEVFCLRCSVFAADLGVSESANSTGLLLLVKPACLDQFHTLI